MADLLTGANRLSLETDSQSSVQKDVSQYPQQAGQGLPASSHSLHSFQPGVLKGTQDTSCFSKETVSH